ncbi:MAG: hypothetical protein RI924_631, partial [Bacteroidota bacterium]
VVLPSCKSKKVIVQPPAPAPAPAPVEPPKPPVEVDTDKDGISDSKDKCPEVAGIAANNGCPEVKAPEPSFTYGNIQFEFNSSVLKTNNYEILDQIARELKAYPGVSILINGHASEEGSTERNMTLSLDRANAVKTYLVNAGVKAENLMTKGFGESAPVASNDTEAGRELNRRVEFKKN